MYSIEDTPTPSKAFNTLKVGDAIYFGRYNDYRNLTTNFLIDRFVIREILYSCTADRFNFHLEIDGNFTNFNRGFKYILSIPSKSMQEDIVGHDAWFSECNAKTISTVKNRQISRNFKMVNLSLRYLKMRDKRNARS